MYNDTIDFIERVKSKYKICLVSDADKEMVESHIEAITFDQIFISEEIESYKGNPDDKMFKKVLKKLNVNADEIMHIGDSSSDIYGSDINGIDTCWINRHQYKKQFDTIP